MALQQLMANSQPCSSAPGLHAAAWLVQTRATFKSLRTPLCCLYLFHHIYLFLVWQSSKQMRRSIKCIGEQSVIQGNIMTPASVQHSSQTKLLSRHRKLPSCFPLKALKSDLKVYSVYPYWCFRNCNMQRKTTSVGVGKWETRFPQGRFNSSHCSKAGREL